MYDPELVRPMREELTSVGVKELKSAQEVDDFMSDKSGTALVIINSVCGCAAGAARPGLRLAIQHSKKPTRLATVFAGNDKEATDRVRSLFSDFPPSSPSIALFKNGEVVDFFPRHRIEGRDAETFSKDLIKMFDEHCD